MLQHFALLQPFERLFFHADRSAELQFAWLGRLLLEHANAHFVAAYVDCDLRQPRLDGAVAAEGVPLSVRAQEDLLANILGKMSIARIEKRGPYNNRAEFVHELLECLRGVFRKIILTSIAGRLHVITTFTILDGPIAKSAADIITVTYIDMCSSHRFSSHTGNTTFNELLN